MDDESVKKEDDEVEETKYQLSKQFQSFIQEHPENSICQVIFKAVDSEYFTFHQIGRLDIGDVNQAWSAAQEQIQLGEDFENVLTVINQLNSARSEYEKGNISLPSFVMRAKDWMSNYS